MWFHVSERDVGKRPQRVGPAAARLASEAAALSDTGCAEAMSAPACCEFLL